MQQMKDLFCRIIREGVSKDDRTGTGTVGIFGHQMRFDMREGFPLVTGKATPFKLIAGELLWFLRGDQDQPGALAELHADNNHIWDEWAKPDGSFGPIYGVQWRRWSERMGIGGIDQIKQVIQQLQDNPTSRRLIVTAWQPAELADMALPPCHILFQLNCRPSEDDGWIVDLQLYQRSCDTFLGVPFNIASYSLLLHMLCHAAGPKYTPGEFIWTGGDVHIYKNHIEQVQQYLRADLHDLPRFQFYADVPRDIDKITLNDCVRALHGYTSGPAIKAPVAV